MFQRFSFDNLTPERKMELLEKQRKQQQQRELLMQQIESKKKDKDNFKENENSRNFFQEQTPMQMQQPIQPPPQSVSPYQFQQNPNQFYPTTIDFSKTSVAPNSFRKQQLVFTPQNYSLLPERQLGRKSAGANREKQMMTMSLTPNTIHDAFASLRHQIMATAASSVIGGPDSRAMRETKITDTF